MSDQSAADARPAAIANATQALAIKELTEEIGGVRKQFKALWIAVGIIGTVTLILAVLTILPRFGVRMGGTGGFQGRAGMSGQQFNGNGTGGTQQQTTPGQ
ncbi:MAG TPA: hypothetical protein VIL17_04315 [Coriobacteriia bacterium]